MEIKEIILRAFEEDFEGIGDITGETIFGEQTDDFVLIAKDDGILCGIDIFVQTFTLLDEECYISAYFKDGDKIRKGDKIAIISGKVASILKAERTAINLLSHLSAIATKANQFAKQAKGKTKILDTRKTLPGLRKLQKYAVKCGGGENHRFGLYDMVMIKDNHIDAAGSITNAVNKIKNRWGDKYKIEVETRDLDEVKEALS